jgi:hypothetical protein
MPRGFEQWFRPFLRGPLATKTTSAPNQWAGRTTLSSGSNTVVISTRSVGSDSLILFTMQAATDQASGVGQGLEVKSVNPGNAFILGWSDGGQVKPARNTTVMWFVLPGS